MCVGIDWRDKICYTLCAKYKSVGFCNVRTGYSMDMCERVSVGFIAWC